MERTGLRAMVELARRYGQGPTPLREVAQVQDLSLPYLERVAAVLRDSELLASVRGAHGGYLLARRPETISVGDVLRAVEGGLIALDCMRDDGVQCERQPICASRNVWQLVADRLEETLDNTSLADLVHWDPAAL
ncbi:MAG: Rrf2 family transcriptional regulator [Anaerolineae bacterium]|nr:Rrf2 family transcriptional regulator [Anaerolineae bacterium]